MSAAVLLIHQKMNEEVSSNLSCDVGIFQIQPRLTCTLLEISKTYEEYESIYKASFLLPKSLCRLLVVPFYRAIGIK
jgi:hypothetical protein